MNKVDAQYSCDFTGYGSGIAAATVAAEYQLPASWPVNNPVNILLATDNLPLPSQVSSQLAGVTDFQVQATVQAKHATAATFTVTGDSPAPSPPANVPVTVSVGQVTFPALGTGSVSLPAASFVITPLAGTTAKPAITCTTTTPVRDVTITIGKATGPFYKCILNGGGVTVTISRLIGMTFAASGKRTVGRSDIVTLSSTDLAGLITGLNSGIRENFTASMSVAGAQSGSVKLAGAITTPASAVKAMGVLHLSKAGTVHLLIPQTIAITLSVQSVPFAIHCALQTSPAPTALTLSVTKASSGGGGHGATGSHHGSTTEGGGIPEGAPATGGGLGQTSGNTAAALGAGAALIVVGGLLLLWARRRRTGELLSSGPWRRRQRRST
jgi:hypothetical protein